MVMVGVVEPEGVWQVVVRAWPNHELEWEEVVPLVQS